MAKRKRFFGGPFARIGGHRKNGHHIGDSRRPGAESFGAHPIIGVPRIGGRSLRVQHIGPRNTPSFSDFRACLPVDARIRLFRRLIQAGTNTTVKSNKTLEKPQTIMTNVDAQACIFRRPMAYKVRVRGVPMNPVNGYVCTSPSGVCSRSSPNY